ncbi:hypothetical protein B0H10DRAFT_2445909 [Mycena sp. CBHHK59/15]|nr:hypothetical protein B0H10DRAFT_2445909 [Mycena sp. CBHHK59/15]
MPTPGLTTLTARPQIYFQASQLCRPPARPPARRTSLAHRLSRARYVRRSPHAPSSLHPAISQQPTRHAAAEAHMPHPSAAPSPLHRAVRLEKAREHGVQLEVGGMQKIAGLPGFHPRLDATLLPTPKFDCECEFPVSHKTSRRLPTSSSGQVSPPVSSEYVPHTQALAYALLSRIEGIRTDRTSRVGHRGRVTRGVERGRISGIVSTPPYLARSHARVSRRGLGNVPGSKITFKMWLVHVYIPLPRLSLNRG